MTARRFVLISDTHEKHNRLPPLPEGDFLIHCGDMTAIGREDEVKRVLRFMARQTHPHKLAVYGNHDSLEIRRTAPIAVDGVRVLFDEAAVVDGIAFYGTPWTYVGTGGVEDPFAAIPDETQVLITHTPPLGILDEAAPFAPDSLGRFGGTGREEPENIGNPLLARHLPRLKNLRLHCFGHVHEDGGRTLTRDGVVFANAACMMDRSRTIGRGALVVDVEV